MWIQELPPEILDQIASILDQSCPTQWFDASIANNHDLVALSSTCRTFRDIVGPFIFRFVSMVRKKETETNRQARTTSSALLESIFAQSDVVVRYSRDLEVDQLWWSRNSRRKFARLKRVRIFRFTPESESTDITNDNLTSLWTNMPDTSLWKHCEALKRLDVLVDFSDLSIDSLLKGFTTVCTASIEEVNIVTRNFTKGFLSASIMLYLTKHADSIRVVGFRALSVTSSVTRQFSDSEYNTKNFVEGLRTLNLSKLALELILLKGLSFEEFANPRDLQSKPYLLEIFNMSTLIQPTVLAFNEDVVVDFVAAISVPEKVNFHYQRNERLYYNGIHAIVNLLRKLHDIYNGKVQYVQIHWAWSDANSVIIAAHNNLGRRYVHFYETTDNCSPTFRKPDEFVVQYEEENVSLIDREEETSTDKEIDSFWSAEVSRHDMEIYFKEISLWI